MLNDALVHRIIDQKNQHVCFGILILILPNNPNNYRSEPQATPLGFTLTLPCYNIITISAAYPYNLVNIQFINNEWQKLTQ
jgi:hypothetical protein